MAAGLASSGALLSWRSPLLMQWTAPIQRRLGAKVQCRMTGRECLLLATNGSQDHAAATSAYPPTADIRWPMSVIIPISSTLPQATDILG